MDNKRKIELFELVLNELKNDKVSNYDTGMCQVITYLYYNSKITVYEQYPLKEFLKDNKPIAKPNTLYFEFTQNKYWINSRYWWTEIHIAPETKQIRIEFLEALIYNLTNNII